MRSRAPLALSPALLAVRILICAAFLPSGIQDLGMMEFTGEQAAKVKRLMNPVPDQPRSKTQAVQTASLVQAADSSLPSEAATSEDPVRARALFEKAILIETTGLGSPVLFAWLAVLFQIIGSSLLLPGLLSRVWAFGLCIISAANFVLLTLPELCAQPMMFLSPTGDALTQTLGAAQLGLFGCSLVILFCGPGAFSLDRLLFGGPRALRRRISDDEELTEDDEE